MTIGELSRDTGVPSSTLRYWEQIGVLPRATRVNGQRRYSSEVTHTIAVLKLAQACGFSLPEMRHLIHGVRPGTSPSERWRIAAGNHRAILQQRIAELNAMRQLLGWVENCECVDLAECGQMARKLLGRVSDAIPILKMPRPGKHRTA